MNSTSFVAIAFHYYVDEYREAFQSFCERVIKHTEGTPGLIRFELLHDADGRRLIGSSLWE
jgi:heme-degrading monooxygenase HmoA